MHCVECGADITYDLDTDAMIADASKACANRATVEACNWSAGGQQFCLSCMLDADHTSGLKRAPFQAAKRRTLRQLLTLDVDIAGRTPALRFELAAGTEGSPVRTGHQNGLITLDTAESDAAHREQLRVNLGEPYRTPLGHVRHELGHWWWATAVGDRFETSGFRSMFGDERLDYQQALSEHYGKPDDGLWKDQYVSHYAASHPWEDFAESFAHYLHIMDTFESAAAHGIVDSGDTATFNRLYERWVWLTVVLNDLNRSMGTPDPYPFAVPAPAITKIAFVATSLAP